MIDKLKELSQKAKETKEEIFTYNFENQNFDLDTMSEKNIIITELIKNLDNTIKILERINNDN